MFSPDPKLTGSREVKNHLGRDSPRVDESGF